MRRRIRPVSGTKHTSRWLAGAVVVAGTMTVAGTSAGPAASAPGGDCPAAFPVDELVAGQAVDGLTVGAGTAPEPFTGSVLGVLEDGIAPGLDMIMTRLTSPEIDRVGGIWAGMSGSPVYAADGRLIGAVAYGLSAGPSTVAGLTPAADMFDLLSGPSGAPRAAAQVEIPDGLAARLVRSGAATAAEADEGMSQLRLPVGVTGLGSQKRFRQFAKRFDLDNVRLMRAGSAAADDAAVNAMVPGGNMAASISYGDVTFAGVGTATAVCAGEVLGFGHPMSWTGPATLTLHGADAVYIQEDPTFAGFKVANIGGPLGTVGQDRLAGIVGVEGALPATSDLTSTVTVGSRTRDGATHVSLDNFVPDIAFGHLLSNMDRVFDGIGQGGADMAYTVRGTREDGTRFTLRRTDVHADEFDITFAATADVANALFELEFNGVEDIRLDSVDVDATLTRTYDHYVLDRVQVRADGRWTRLNENRTLRIRAGTVKRFRAVLESADSGMRRVVLEVRVPRRTAGRTGLLQVAGGNSFFLAGDSGSAADEPTFDDILRSLRRQPQNNHVVADLSFTNRRGDVTNRAQDRVLTPLVVDGGIAVQVRSVR